MTCKYSSSGAIRKVYPASTHSSSDDLGYVFDCGGRGHKTYETTGSSRTLSFELDMDYLKDIPTIWTDYPLKTENGPAIGARVYYDDGTQFMVMWRGLKKAGKDPTTREMICRPYETLTPHGRFVFRHELYHGPNRDMPLIDREYIADSLAVKDALADKDYEAAEIGKRYLMRDIASRN